MALWRANGHRMAYHGRPMPPSLFLHEPPRPIGSTTAHKDKFKNIPQARLSSPITFGLLSILGTLAINSLCDSCFSVTRTSIVVLSSILFLPLVRPTWWLTKVTIKISLWSTLYAFSLFNRASESAFQLATSIAYNYKNRPRQGIIADWKSNTRRTCVGLIAAYVLTSGVPLLQVATIWSRAIRFGFRLLRAYALMQYYMLLLASLELMIYMRMDCVMALISAPWFRWVVHRMWSVLTWKDIILAFSPSAYYYVHLSLYGK